MADKNKPQKIATPNIDAKISRVKPTNLTESNQLTRSIQRESSRIVDTSDVGTSVHQNFKILNRKVDLLTNQFVKVEKQFLDYDRIVNEKISISNHSIADYQNRLGRELNKSFDNIETDIKQVNTRISRQNDKIDQLKSQLDFLKLRNKENEFRWQRQTAPPTTQKADQASGISLKSAGIGLLAGGALAAALMWAYNNRQTIMNVVKTAQDTTKALGITGSLKAATTTAKAVQSTAKIAASAGKATKSALINAFRKALGKQGIAVGAKKIPIFGMLVGGGMAAYRYAIGDSEGAMMELGSGATSMIPGVGTVGSLAIDVSIIARDAYYIAYQVYPREDPLAAERWPELYDALVEYMSGTSKEELEKQEKERPGSTVAKAISDKKISAKSGNVSVSSTDKDETKNVEIKTTGDIFLDSLRKINIESKDEIRLKANKIILDAPNIEIRTSRSRVTYGNSTSTGSRTSSTTSDPRKIENPVNPNDPGANRANEVLGNTGSGEGYTGGNSYDASPPPVTNEVTLPPVTVDQGPSAIKPSNVPPALLSPSAPDRVLKPVGPDSNISPVKQGPGSTLSPAQAASTTGFIPGGPDRRKFERELQDPQVRELFRTMMAAEVGSQGREAQVGFAETVFNRAQARGVSLKTILSSRSYYQPYKDGGFNRAQRRMNDKLRSSYDNVLDEVYRGTNTTNMATDNASAGLARRIKNHGAHDFHSGDYIGGELFYNKTIWQKGLKNIPRHEEAATPKPDETPNYLDNKTRESFEDKHGKPMMVGAYDKTNQPRSNPNDIIKKVVDGQLSPQSKAFEDAMTQHGLHERRDRKALQNYLGGWNPVGKSNAWCSVFVNTALKNAGIKPTGSAVASSYLNWGQQITDAKEVTKGDVLVRTHSRHGNGRRIRAGQTGSHVSMASGNYRWVKGSGKNAKVVPEGTPGARLQIEKVGGNQSDMVSTRWIEADRVQIRRSNEQVAFMSGQQHPSGSKQNLLGPNVNVSDSNLKPAALADIPVSRLNSKPVISAPKLIENTKPVLGTQSTPADNSRRNVAQAGAAKPSVDAQSGPTPGSSEFWGQGKQEKETPPPAATASDNVSSRGVSMPRNEYAGDSMPPMPGSDGTGNYSPECLI